MREWQPIETAPKNTAVLIWDGRMMATAELVTDLVISAEWYAVGATAWGIENDFGEPTHWMPLPDPPR